MDKIEFQTAHPESNTRLNVALDEIEIDLLHRKLGLTFNLAHYDNKEIRYTIVRHWDRNVQNIKIFKKGILYTMTIDPLGIISTYDSKLTLRYEINAYTMS